MDRVKDEGGYEYATWTEEGNIVSLRSIFSNFPGLSLIGGPGGVRKILYYIACIRQLQRNAKALGNSMIVDKMNGAPRIIIDGLIKRFTETAKGSTK